MALIGVSTPPIGKLMHDFSCRNPDDIINDVLRKRVSYLKNTEGGREQVCQIMENRITEEKIMLAKRALETGKYTNEEMLLLSPYFQAKIDLRAKRERKAASRLID